MRVLLTGAAGFLGRRLRERLEREHEVWSVVRPGSTAAPGPTVLNLDLGELAQGQGLPPRIDAVIHAAQSSRYREFPEGVGDGVRINVAATAALLEYALRAEASRFCYMSSGTVYEPYAAAMTEDRELTPTSLNGATKAAGEMLCRAFSHRLPVSMLRLFSPYGPGQVDRMVPDIIQRVIAGHPIRLAGRDGLRFAPIFVDDVAEVVRRATAEGWKGPVNLAGREQFSLRAFAETIGWIVDREPVFEPGEGVAQIISPDLSRLEALASDRPHTDVESGLRATLAEIL